MTRATHQDALTGVHAARVAIDRVALDRLAFDIRMWWARNRQLLAQILLELAERQEERGRHRTSAHPAERYPDHATAALPNVVIRRQGQASRPTSQLAAASRDLPVRTF